MQALRRSSGLFRATLRQHLTQRANISAKPAKHVVSTGEHVIALMSMFVTILVPSGWILNNLENYKKRP
ncbi:cytochrome c oxidase subunit 8B, mitochondrial [Tachysurus ichikawai]